MVEDLKIEHIAMASWIFHFTGRAGGAASKGWAGQTARESAGDVAGAGP